MRWCVTHDAQEAGSVTMRFGSLAVEAVCWRAAFEPGGSLALSCAMVEVAEEPLAEMKRTVGDEEPGEGWHLIVDSADKDPGEEPLAESDVRWRLWSKTVGYRRVLPRYLDPDGQLVDVLKMEGDGGNGDAGDG